MYERTVNLNFKIEPPWRWWRWGSLFELHLYMGPRREGDLENVEQGFGPDFTPPAPAEWEAEIDRFLDASRRKP